MSYIKHLLLLITLCFPVISNAKCEKWIPNLLETYHSSRESSMAICKIWPADESKTIVVLPLLNKSEKNSDDLDVFDLDVLLIDSLSGKLIARHWQTNALVAEVTTWKYFEIDTARYQLNPQSQAFGVRINYKSNSRFDDDVDEENEQYNYEQYINLYIEQNEKLNCIVNKLLMSDEYSKWYPKRQCQGEFHFRNRTLSLGQDSTKNYANLIISEKSQEQISSNCMDGIIDIKYLPKKKFILRYNGIEYPITDQLK